MAIKEGQKVGARIVLGNEYTNEEGDQFDGFYHLNSTIEERIEVIRHGFIDIETLCQDCDDCFEDESIEFSFSMVYVRKS